MPPEMRTGYIQAEQQQAAPSSFVVPQMADFVAAVARLDTLQAEQLAFVAAEPQVGGKTMPEIVRAGSAAVTIARSDIGFDRPGCVAVED